jgi:hypothetical protein
LEEVEQDLLLNQQQEHQDLLLFFQQLQVRVVEEVDQVVVVLKME